MKRNAEPILGQPIFSGHFLLSQLFLFPVNLDKNKLNHKNTLRQNK
jgi:hypothetical protein